MGGKKLCAFVKITFESSFILLVYEINVKAWLNRVSALSFLMSYRSLFLKSCSENVEQ